MSALPTHQTLRQTILRNAIPLVSQYSFTRSALLSSIRQLPIASTSANVSPVQTPEALLESLFGRGIEPEKSLVREWEAQGLQSMKDAFSDRSVEGSNGVVAVTMARAKGKAHKKVDFPALKTALGKRIRWSSETAGEHLVQAHSLLATPTHQLSTVLPRPLTLLASRLGSALHLDAPYTPPQDTNHASPQRHDGTRNENGETQHVPTITLPLVNPLPLLQYGIKIADEALYVSGAEPETVSGELDWYTRRLGIAMIYLHAGKFTLAALPEMYGQADHAHTTDGISRTESHLLHPRTNETVTMVDPQLPAAIKQLDASMARYESLAAAGGRLAEVRHELGEFGWFVWKSWGGLFRSRGWIQ
ncbi:hypothetical protein QFC22_005307 [Naganishia vaughanmartiniae]|uniref:Uncharacterized protein n=1 Tax=Naganishia vaughanmartiniae TaxID=1424756 RepID=A0ACC2WV33_9TREE|nr:hypothetical protein QFC22_005307 [Naganishia vaughanmartiniae]